MPFVIVKVVVRVVIVATRLAIVVITVVIVVIIVVIVVVMVVIYFCSRFERSGGPLLASWSALGGTLWPPGGIAASWGLLGAVPGSSWDVLGRSWGRLEVSWSALEATVAPTSVFSSFLEAQSPREYEPPEPPYENYE